MELNEYQNEAVKAGFYEGTDVTYCALGITGEAGEVADHVKKMWRDDDGELTDDRRKHLIKELGDTMWYISQMAYRLDCTLEEVAITNLNKIKDRVERQVQHGSGDDR